MSQLPSRTIFLCLIFMTGGIVLSLELLASRILSPFFGVSLYIWTAILSVTLTFLAIGYQFGGWITEHIEEKKYETLLISIPILSTLFIFLSCLLYPIILPLLSSTDLLNGSFIGSILLLAVPLIFLSALNPILISLLRQSTTNRDSNAGFVFFISTIGSVAGVLTTTLLIIPHTTNFSAMLINGIVLVLCSITVHIITQNNRTHSINIKIWISSLVMILLCSSLLFWKSSYLSTVTTNKDSSGIYYTVLEELPSHYGNLKVIKVSHKNTGKFLRYKLFQDGISQNETNEAGKSLSPYTYILTQLTNYAPQADSALILGFGAGIVPHKLQEKGIQVTVVDINPDTLKVAKKYFNYKQKMTKLFFEDARTFTRRCSSKYDIIIIDLFQGDGMPEHITTKEFYENIKKCMSENSILISNNFIHKKNKTARMSLLATVKSAFNKIYFFQNLEAYSFNAYIVAAKKDLPKTIDFNFTDTPKEFQKEVILTLKSKKEYKQDVLNKFKIISDESNTFSSLFANQNMYYRKLISTFYPSRILIN